MRDEKVSLPRIILLHPRLRDEAVKCIDWAEQGFPQKIKVRVTDSLRTEQEQNDLYAQGRTKSGDIVTNAKFGQSFHNFGLAIDFCLMYDLNEDGNYETASWDINKNIDEDKMADWKEVVLVFKSFGWTWGGDFKTFKDTPHLERSFGYSWNELLAKYNKKDFIEGTKYVVL